jgi:hypothetical protein
MTNTTSTDRTIKSLATRCRKLIAQLAAGDYASTSDATDLMVKVNALTLKLDRAGAPALADELMASKSAAVEVGRAARQQSAEAAVKTARDEHRDALRNDPAAWMRR